LSKVPAPNRPLIHRVISTFFFADEYVIIELKEELDEALSLFQVSGR
jgi:hypothetical protein